MLSHAGSAGRLLDCWTHFCYDFAFSFSFSRRSCGCQTASSVVTVVTCRRPSGGASAICPFAVCRLSNPRRSGIVIQRYSKSIATRGLCYAARGSPIAKLSPDSFLFSFLVICRLAVVIISHLMCSRFSYIMHRNNIGIELGSLSRLCLLAYRLCCSEFCLEMQ